MTPKQVTAIVARGEDSRHQFKRDFTNVESLAAELAAFANMGGGTLLIDVPEGLNKPYVDTHGRIWVKTGADKRQVTAREEMQRIFQQAGLLHADEQAVSAATLDNIDQPEFAKYFERRARINRAGHRRMTPTPVIATLPNQARYRTRTLNSDSSPRLPRRFAPRNDDQRGSPCSPQVMDCFTTFAMTQRALVHRDYLISATIRLMIFVDRVEIISPGHLPNHLTTVQIRFGLSNLRNPALASHAFHILPYQGMGSGILRAIEAWPHIEFVDERNANQFRVVLKRPGVQVGGANEGVNDNMSEKMSEKVFSALQADPKSTIADLATQIGVTTRTIERALTKLRQENRVTRIGADRGGHWKVISQP
jgi:predicted HTH transcriptional regulator